MSRVIDYLEAHQSSSSSHWREDAQWRRDNEYWLQYSRVITLRTLKAMEEQSVTQAELARRMGCSQQYVSNLLKGSSNMTLETIGRLEKALNLDILRSSMNPEKGYLELSGVVQPMYLNDPALPEEGICNGTSAYVDGYAKGKRKKEKGR